MILSLMARGPFRMAKFSFLSRGVFEFYRLMDRQAAKSLVADIDSVKIDVFAAFVGDKPEAAIGSQAFNGAVRHASSVTNVWRIHQRLFGRSFSRLEREDCRVAPAGQLLRRIGDRNGSNAQ